MSAGLRSWVCAALAPALLLGCGGSLPSVPTPRLPSVPLPSIPFPRVPGPWQPEQVQGDPAYGVEVLTEGGIPELHGLAIDFYTRLANRRVNAFRTYQDEAVRGYFQTEAAFADYYADLVQSFHEAHFEQNRPLTAEVHELLLDGPGRARITVRFTGKNSVPLRFGSVELVREDRWERAGGQWWVIPGKL